jgi:hypothetical protein
MDISYWYAATSGCKFGGVLSPKIEVEILSKMLTLETIVTAAKYATRGYTG